MKNWLSLHSLYVIGHLLFCSILCSFAAEGGHTPFSQTSNTYESAVSLAEKKQVDKALDVCDALIEKKSSRSLDALKLKIQLYEKTGRFAEALTHYDRLLRMVPDQADRTEIRANMARIKALELDDARSKKGWRSDKPSAPAIYACPLARISR